MPSSFSAAHAPSVARENSRGIRLFEARKGSSGEARLRRGLLVICY
jgi:hypothetical protein